MSNQRPLNQMDCADWLQYMEEVADDEAKTYTKGR